MLKSQIIKWVMPVNTSVLLTVLTTSALNLFLKSTMITIINVTLLAYLILFYVNNFYTVISYYLTYSDNEVFHVHTEFSHDATINKEDIVMLANNENVSRIHLTDHNQDLDESKFHQIIINYGAIEKVVVGVEYVFGVHHILALGVESFVSNNNDDLNTIADKSSKLILAHPRIAFRKIFNKEYVQKYLYVLNNVDGIEIMNNKTKSLRAKMEHICICLLTIIFVGRKELIKGVDAHYQTDLSVLTTQ